MKKVELNQEDGAPERIRTLASGATGVGDRELEVVLSLIERGGEAVTETDDEQTNERLSTQKARLEQFAEVAGAFAAMLDELKKH